MVRAMTMDDYDDVYALWMSIHGFGIRSVDDSREGIERFIKRIPGSAQLMWKTVRLSERFSAGMMAEEPVCIMFA